MVMKTMERTYNPGETIIKEGDQDRAVYLLKSGRLGILKRRRLVAEIRNPGVPFGEMSVILDQPRSATVKALTPCVIEVYAEGITALARDNPHIVKIILRVLAERLAETTARLHSYMFVRAEQKAAAPDSPITSFRDVTTVDDRIIERVIATISNDDLVAALLGSTPGVRDKFFKNMSRRKMDMIEEDMRIAIRVCTRKAIELAQQRILKTIKELTNAQKYALSF